MILLLCLWANHTFAQFIVLEDYTSIIVNSDFKNGSPVTNTICMYDYNMEDNGVANGGMGLFGQQSVPGWKAREESDNTRVSTDNNHGVRTDNLNGRAAGVFAYDLNSKIGLGGDYYPHIEGGDKQGLGLVAVWGANLIYSQHVSLPEGDYLLIAKQCNIAGNGKVNNNFGFKVNDAVYYYSNMTRFPVKSVLESQGKDYWIKDSVIFRLNEPTEGDIILGYYFGSGSNSAPHLIVDNVRLLRVAPTGLDQQQIDKAKNELKTLIDEATRFHVETSDSESVYNDPLATLDQVKEAIDKQKVLNFDVITDLSQFFIMNPSFAVDIPVSDGICTYKEDMERINVMHYGMQPVTGWRSCHPNKNSCASGIFETGTTAFLGDISFTPPTTLSDGSKGKLLGLVACWNGTVQYIQSVTLPAGSYSLAISYFNMLSENHVGKNLFGFIADDGTEYLGTTKTFFEDGWSKETIAFTLDAETSGYFSIGYTSINTGSGNMPHLFIDSMTLLYVGNYTIPQFKVIYKIDEQPYSSSLFYYKSPIIPEDYPQKEGYTFSGWSEIPETMPAHDVTVTGSFSINDYMLTYVVDGERVYEEVIAYNSALTPKEELTKEGYTFSGWSDIPETMPAHDVTITGSFAINSYKLTYMLDGTKYSEEEIEYNTALSQKAPLTKEGYTFSGWSEIPETMPAHDLTITGSFSINSYKLTYIVDGVTYKETEVAYGNAISPEKALEQEGYTFSGWSDIPETMPAHDVNITASFTKGQYQLIYMVDGQVYKTFSNDYQDAITPEAAPLRDGYTFSGWDEVPETMPAHDVTVHGTFTINSYKLTYMLDEVEYCCFDIVYGDSLPNVNEPTKDHHTFTGWSDIPETMPAHDVVVSGNLILDTYKVIFKIDGVIYKTMVVGYGMPIIPEPNPEKEGYTFSGWSWIPSKMPAEDVIVTAQYTPNEYVLVYMVDGIEYKSYQVKYDSSIKPEALPVKEGYTFSGWSWIPSRMPAERVIITGSFTINQYSITFIVEGDTLLTEVLDYGSTINTPELPEITGYTFIWGEVPATMPAKDLTFRGRYELNSYHVTFIVNNQVYAMMDVPFGSSITPPEVPERDGCCFSWTEYPSTMPAYDIVIEGGYTDSIRSTMNDSKYANSSAVIYSLSGQRLSKPQRGVNIIDGKKVVVK